MATITFEDFKCIAALKYDKGFNLLLECLQANIDNLSNELAIAEPGKEAQVLARWRVFREIFVLFKERRHSNFRKIWGTECRKYRQFDF